MGTDRTWTGLVLLTLASFSFGIGGPFVKPLLEAGWTPGAAVLARTAGATLLLLVPALVALRGRWGVVRRNWRAFAVYGGFAVVGAQLCYYSAIERLSVGVALLIEYLAPVILVVAAWVRTRRSPGAFTLAGTVVALTGLALVVNPAGGARIDALGVVLALGAAFGAAVYYAMSAKSDPDLPPIVLLTGSMAFATALLLVLGLAGVAPMRAALGPVELLGSVVPWFVPLAVVVGVSTVAAYSLGIAGSSRLGARLASFVGLSEVLFAILLAWLLLGDVPAPLQFVGGALILTGVVLVRSQKERAADAGASVEGEAEDGSEVPAGVAPASPEPPRAVPEPATR